MKKHFWKCLFAMLLVVCFACVVFAGCVPDPVTDPDDSKEDNTYEYLNELSNAIANAIAVNPKKGLAFDLAASAQFAFEKEDKKQYDWGYSVSINGNLFADDANKQGFSIELKNDKASAAEVEAGEDILLGLYNTADEHLYVQAGTTKFNFENASVFASLKAMLLANGVNLDVILRDLQIAEIGTLGGITSLVMVAVSASFDKIEKVEAGYNAQFRLSALINMIKDLIGSLGAGDITLPAELTNTEIDFNVLFKVTKGTFVGVEMKDNALTTQDGAGSGTLNINADFSLTETTEAIDIAANVSKTLKALPATKILNLEAQGKIEMTKPDTSEEAADGATAVARNFEWEIHANIDLFRMLEENFVLGASSISNNYLHFRLLMDGEVFLDLAWAPDQMETGDIVVVANLPQLLTAIGQESIINTICGTEGFLAFGMGKDYIIQIDSTALGYLIGGQGGLIPTPGTGEGGGEGGDTPSAGIDIAKLVNDLMGVVQGISIANGEMNMDLSGLFNMLQGLAGADIMNMVNGLLSNATDAKFYHTTASFANPDINYDVAVNLKKELTADGTTKDRDFYSSKQPVAGVFDKQYVTNEGFLQLYQITTSTSASSNKLVFDAKDTPVSIVELNQLIAAGNLGVRYTGTDITGKEVKGQLYSSVILGFLGVDPTKFGVPQEVTVITSWADPQGLMRMAGTLGPMLGMDLPLVQPMAQVKVKIVLSEIESVDTVLKNESVDITSKIYRTGDKFRKAATSITATIKYKASEYFPDGKTKVIETSGSDALKDTNPIRINNYNTTFGKMGSNDVITAQENFVVEGEVFGIPFAKTVQVKAAESIQLESVTYPKATPLAMIVGDTALSAANLAKSFKFTFTYDDGVVYKGITLPESDMIVVNAMEMVGVSDYNSVTSDTVWLSAGDVKVRFKLNGKHDLNEEFSMKIVERTATYDAALNNFVTTNGKISATLNLNVKQETAVATQDAFVSFQPEVYYYNKTIKAWSKTQINNLVITVGGMAGGNSGILSKTMAEAKDFTISINGDGIVATERYYVSVSIVELQSGKELATASAIAFDGIDLVKSLSTSSAITDRATLEIRGVATYKLTWVEGATFVFRAAGQEDIAASVVFKNANGEDITSSAINTTNGRPTKNTDGTIEIKATYNETEYTVVGFVDL